MEILWIEPGPALCHCAYVPSQINCQRTFMTLLWYYILIPSSGFFLLFSIFNPCGNIQKSSWLVSLASSGWHLEPSGSVNSCVCQFIIRFLGLADKSRYIFVDKLLFFGAVWSLIEAVGCKSVNVRHGGLIETF